MESKKRILIIEDEFGIRSFVAINLKEAGYEVQEAATGEEGLKLAEEFKPELVVLDVMLPGMDGYQVCKVLRESYQEIGILLLTAKGQDMDKIIGLELGADDYMVKPFNPLELLARIKAILRRSRPALQYANDTIRSALFELDLTAKTFKKSEREIELTPKEYLIIKIFMENPQSAFSRDELLNLAWGEAFFGDTKTVDVNIRRLREKIEEDPSNPKHIQTVWGYGYRWSGEA